MKKHENGLSAWQLTMMALGSVIGGSFFLGSAVAIKAAGPAIVISYILGGILIYFILFALSEMTVANPDSGSFYTFTAQVYGPDALPELFISSCPSESSSSAVLKSINSLSMESISMEIRSAFLIISSCLKALLNTNNASVYIFLLADVRIENKFSGT
jgi:amino acid transporter